MPGDEKRACVAGRPETRFRRRETRNAFASPGDEKRACIGRDHTQHLDMKMSHRSDRRLHSARAVIAIIALFCGCYYRGCACRGYGDHDRGYEHEHRERERR
jgi:hypothetical protein